MVIMSYVFNDKVVKLREERNLDEEEVGFL